MKKFTINMPVRIILSLIIGITLFSSCDNNDDDYYILDNLPGTWAVRQTEVISYGTPYAVGDYFTFFANGGFTTNYGETGYWSYSSSYNSDAYTPFEGYPAILLEYPLGNNTSRYAAAFITSVSDGYMNLYVVDYYNNAIYRLIMTRY